MKNIVTLLFLGFLAVSCLDGQKNQTNTKKVELTNVPMTIAGTWTIKKYYFSDISAMDEKMASEWLDKTLIIDSNTHFNFENIQTYKEVFRNENDCEIINIEKPEIVKPSDYFDMNRDPVSDLNIKGMIKIFRTKCKDNPFSEFEIGRASCRERVLRFV